METVKRKFEISRKVIHLLSLGMIISAYYYVGITQVVILCFILIYSYSEWRKVNNRPFILHHLILKMQRDEERTRWAKAPLFLAIGVLFAITLFSWEAFTIGIYQAGLCDTVAAFCGKRWGGTPFPVFSTRKTLTGTLAFIAVALPVALYFLSPAQAIVICLVGGFLESLPFKDWDNLTVPFIVTFLAELFLH